MKKWRQNRLFRFMVENSSVWKKLGAFVGIQLLCMGVAVCILAGAFSSGSGFVLLWMPALVAVCGLVSFFIWFWKERNLFESLLVYITSTCFLFAFLLCAPFVVERSLSCFVYFYAVEQGKVSPELISADFTQQFIQKRFDDGVDGHFLTKQGNTYYPTGRAKLFYAIYEPLGQLTHTLKNYQHFKSSAQIQQHISSSNALAQKEK